MVWEMQIDEVESVLEKIWDLHDKLSDSILSISRSHFLHSLKFLRTSSSGNFYPDKMNGGDGDGGGGGGGYVYVKEYQEVDVEDLDEAVREAKSLNAIRTALEQLKEELEFFHTMQTQQRAERDAAIARLEQSRIMLALKLAEHQGKRYQVIEEARAFVGEVHDHGKFSSTESCFGSAGCSRVPHEGKKSNFLFRFAVSSFNFARKSLKLDHMGGLLGNAALVAVTMFALLHFQQVADRGRFITDVPQRKNDDIYSIRMTKVSQPDISLSTDRSSHLDVLLARG